MVRIVPLTILLFFAPLSILAQADKQAVQPIKRITPISNYGLIQKELPQKRVPDSMPILHPKNVDAQMWFPSFQWFNSIPVIGGPEKEADFLNYWWWKQDSTQND